MKRPGIKQKKTGSPEEEPDFYKISNLHPVPVKAEDDSILLECTVQGGPKARMPIYTAVTSSSSYLPATATGSAVPAGGVAQMPFQSSLVTSAPVASQEPIVSATAPVATATAVSPAEAKPPALQSMMFPTFPVIDPAAMAQLPGFASMDQAAAAQFAAGFAMAAAYSQQTFMTSMMEHMSAKKKQDEGQKTGTSQ